MEDMGSEAWRGGGHNRVCCHNGVDDGQWLLNDMVNDGQKWFDTWLMMVNGGEI